MSPDSPLVADTAPSPNHNGRRGGNGSARTPDMIVLHYTGMETAEAALDHLRDPAAEVSAHYLVLEDGRIVQMVPEAQRAWHAGVGCWAGERDINSCSIGIEIVNAGHPGGLPPYPEAQIEAVIALVRDIVDRRSIRPERVVAHSDVAPDRKEDPGEHFPWNRLAGLAHWVRPAANGDGRFLSPGEEGEPVEALQALLGLYGYDCPVSGRFDERTTAVVTAFQRRFRPSRVDGIADAATITTLRNLLATLPPATSLAADGEVA